MQKYLLGFLLSCTLSGVASADYLKTEIEIQALTDAAMEKVGKGDLVGALKILEPVAAITGAEYQTAVLGSQAQHEQMTPRLGKTIGHEFLEIRKVGQSLVRLTYIEKTEKTALPWVFYFYNNGNGWIMNTFFWNDKPQMLFSEQ